MAAQPIWTVIAGVNMETNVPVYGFPLQLGTAHYVNNQIMDELGGVAANLAIGLQTLGQPTQVVSVIGEDFLGTEVLWQLAGYGVNTDAIRTDYERTSRTVILVAPDGERQLLCDFRDASKYHYPDTALASTLSRAGRWVYTSTHDWVRYAALAANQAGKFVATDVHDVVDVDDYHRDFYQAASLIFVSLSRLRPSVTDFAHHLYEGFGVQTVVGMDAARGAWLVDGASGDTRHYPAHRVAHVIDTVGAGDALAAGFCAALSAGLSLEACLNVGQQVAAHKIQHRGTLAFPPPEAVGLASGKPQSPSVEIV
ncbi:MAG: carbohydrate kinase family protein [Anaerolineae bacterium]|nr:carbohydrate kinase family protein [Anaerolineae bacterium]